MARPGFANPDDQPGYWFVDTRCIRCDASRHWGEGLVGMDGRGRSVVIRQPETPEDEAAMWRASVACPTKSIGNRNQARPPSEVFPYQLTPGVLALGHNPRNGFGVHSYLITRSGGNLVTDSPRYTRQLTRCVDDLGGIAHVLLGHRDDIADADKWAQRYGARVWIHRDEVAAAPYATDIVNGDHTISPGVDIVHAPGDTSGHVLFHIDRQWLYTGDTLHWNPRRGELDVTPKQTWHSWDELADSMERIAALTVEWVFPGHGMWHHIGAESYRQQTTALAPAMRQLGQRAWAQRPSTTYGWY